MTDSQFPTWIFVRGTDQLIVRRHSDHELSISAGDDPPRSFYFDSLRALVGFHLNLEDDLLDEGWTLTTFAPERRQGPEDRRAISRSGADRRQLSRPRRSTH